MAQVTCFFLNTTHLKSAGKAAFLECYTVNKLSELRWMFLRAIQAKNPHLQMIMCLLSDTRDLLNSFEMLIVAVVQSNAHLFVIGGKYRLKKNQPIRSHYSKSSTVIGRGTDLCPAGCFCRFEDSLRKPSLNRQQHQFNSIQSE